MKELENEEKAIVSVFSNTEFGSIRTAGTKDEPLFCLVDVCRALGLENVQRVKQRLDEGGVLLVHTPTYNQHGALVMQNQLFVNEPNFYKCVFQSRKPDATKFQNWVYYEVLPAIRKTGKYEIENANIEFIDKIREDAKEMHLDRIAGVKIRDKYDGLLPYMIDFISKSYCGLVSAFSEYAVCSSEVCKMFDAYLKARNVNTNKSKKIEDFLKDYGVPHSEINTSKTKYFINLDYEKSLIGYSGSQIVKTTESLS